mgnify:CR=1 FL=1
MRSKRTKGLLGTRLGEADVVVHPSERGELKHALLQLGQAPSLGAGPGGELTAGGGIAVERGGDNEALGYRHSEHMRRVARTCERPQDVAARITHTCACGACGATRSCWC